ncbi:sushi domain protein [Ostertagia ostertagi]
MQQWTVVAAYTWNMLYGCRCRPGLTCPAMMTPFGGMLSYSMGGTAGPFQSGSTVTLMCTSGSVTGTSSATCTNGQWSPPTLGTCSTTGAGTGGSSSALCSNGQWTPPTLGTCSTTGGGIGGIGGGIGGIGGTGSTCPAMTTPLGATLNYSSGNIFGPFTSGSTVTMNCSSGSPLGATTATCSNGQWFPPSLGTCNPGTGGGIIGGGIGQNCPTLTAPPGGTISMSNGLLGTPATQGTIATLTCLGGTVQGTTSVLCTNGMWTPPTLGTCNSSTGIGGGGIGGGGIGGSTTTCPAMTTPIGASLSYSNFLIFPPFPPGTTVTARCLNGAAITGTSMATCQNGFWTPPILGTCGTSTGGGLSGTGTCPSTPAIGGRIDYSDDDLSTNHAAGSTATLLCTSGTPIGSALSTCQNGQWTPPIGSCTTTGNTSGVSCIFAPFSPFGSTLSYSTGSTTGPWTQGAIATMTCPPGQNVIGSSTSTCNNGVWTTLGSCSTTAPTGSAGSLFPNRFPCYFGLVEPLNGSITYSDPTPPYSDGSTATLRCNAGYTVTGSASSTCTDGSFTAIGTCTKTL